MLKHLYIRNLALVDEQTIDFNPGLTVITGETGAGKSMLLNALGLALGDRFNPALLSNNQKAGQVVAGFSLDDPNHPAHHWLADNDLTDNSQCLLRRSFSSSSNRCYINGVPVTQTQMGQLGDLLIELHGQHQHHSLLHQPEQAKLFDSYSQQLPLADTVASLHRKKKSIAQELKILESNLEKANSDRQYLSFQLQELESLAPLAGEYQRMDQQQRQLGKRQQLTEVIARARDYLEGNDSSNVPGSISSISQISRDLANMPFDSCQNVAKLFEQVEIQLTEASLQIQAMGDTEDLDSEQIIQLEQRLAQWHSLGRKHNVEPDKLPDLLEDFRQKINSIDNGDETVQELRKKHEAIKKQHQQACDELSKYRQHAAAPFSKSVTDLVQSLAMPDANFRVELQKQEASAQGNEKVQFVIKINPGSSESALNKIVSGGELSRISLAIHQSNHEAQEHSRCMVFDEIDVGMSGAVAERIGQMLRSLGNKSQIICITHQPQVTAKAHNHLLASKHRNQQSVSVDLQPLDQPASVEEIARMLGSEGTRQKSLDLAKEMYLMGRTQ